MGAALRTIASRSNPLLVRLRKLAADPAAYRKTGTMLLEGEHLCAAWIAHRRGAVLHALVDESAVGAPALRGLLAAAEEVVVVPTTALAGISGLESTPAIVFVVATPAAEALRPKAPTLVLDRLQDPGNAGALLRSAAAFGFTQVVALVGTTALWAPKVVRAGMGAHFALHVVEAVVATALDALEVPMFGTSSHAPTAVDEAELAWPCAWLLGHEGQGVDAALLERCRAVVQIPQPGGQESLNVAAAGAVCLYESARRRRADARKQGTP